jgi:hypothetical protein
MDPVSLIVSALASGAAQGTADSASDMAKAAYRRLLCLITDRFAGDKRAELVLAEHANDPATWQAPMASALADSGAATDQLITEAARQLLELLGKTDAGRGKYRVDLSGAYGVQVGDRNYQHNVFGAADLYRPDVHGRLLV